MEASFWVGSDGKELFIAVVSETPPGGKLLARVAPLPDGRDARTWLDDSIELVLAPEPAAPPGKCRLYHAVINAQGAVHDTLYVVGGNASPWRGHWRTASKVVGDRWHFELALPLADLGLASLPLGQPLGIRIGRNWQQTPIASQTEWSPLGGAYLEPSTLPRVTWDAAAPVVQMRQLAVAGRAEPELKLTVLNPGSAALPVKVAMSLKPTNSAPSDVARTITVQPGQTVPIELAGAGRERRHRDADPCDLGRRKDDLLFPRFPLAPCPAGGGLDARSDHPARSRHCLPTIRRFTRSTSRRT